MSIEKPVFLGEIEKEILEDFFLKFQSKTTFHLYLEK